MVEDLREQTIDESLHDEDTSQDAAEEGTEQNASPDGQDTEQQLLAGKYKSPEELAKAYKEVESTLGKKSQEMKDLENRYNQLMNQFTYAQQQQYQKAQQNEYETDEERLAKEVQGLKAGLAQQANLQLYNSFVSQHEELKGDVERELFDSKIYQARSENPYAPPDQILSLALEKTRGTLGRIRESAQRETTETRREVKSQSSPKGTARKEVDSSPKTETYSDYMAWRSSTANSARRTH